MLKLNNISKSYGKRKVIEKLNLEFLEGEFTTLLGPNGIGKSTLLKIIGGSTFPDQGEVNYRDQSVFAFNFKYTNEIAFVHEEVNYSLPLSFEKFIKIMSSNIPNWDQEYFKKLSKEVGFSFNENYKSYSRGQKMQLSLILSLAMNPKLILLDEITSVLDTKARKFFLDELKKFTDKGGPVVITSNIVSELDYYSDRVIILNDGVVRLDAKRNEINAEFVKLRKKHNSEHPVFLDENCIWAGINSDRSESFIIDKVLVEKHKIDQEFLDKRVVTLEDIFLYYFKQ